jgi:hypothetical protein
MLSDRRWADRAEEQTMALTKYPYQGKFEGEVALAPLAYDASLDGFGEPYDFGGDGFVDHYTVCQGPLTISDADREEHDLTDEDVAFAGGLLGFIVHENDQGFVSVTWFEKGEEVRLAKAIAQLDDEISKLTVEDEDEDSD